MTRDFLLTGLSLFAWGIGEGMFLIFQPLYLQKLGASPVEIGAILGAVGICMVFVQAPVGYLSDRIGPRLLMWLSWVLGLTSTILMAWAGSLGMFVAGMLIYGVTSMVVSPMNAYITQVRGSFSVERALTINSAVYNAGAMIGPIVGGALGNRLGLQPVYRFAAGLFLISTIIILFISHQKVEHIPAETGQKGTAGSLFTNRRYLAFLALSLLILFVAYLPQPLTPNFLQNQRGLTYDKIGLISSIGNASNMVITLLLGGLSARWGVLAGQALLCLFALVLWRGSGVVWAGIAYSFLGGYRLVRLLGLAFARSLVHGGQVGLAYGLIETANAVAIILAPPAAGLLYARNPLWVYTTSLVLMVITLAACAVVLPAIQKEPVLSKSDMAKTGELVESMAQE